jgi:hypothetical protein
MLSYIAMQFFHDSPLLAYPLFALASFFLVYLAWLLKTALVSAERFEAVARLPLELERAPQRKNDT